MSRKATTSTWGHTLKKWSIRAAIALLALAGLLFVILRIADEPRPVTTPSPEADALARQMMAAANTEAWQRTGAVSWNFGGRNDHLWDRDRNFVRVSRQNQVVWLDLDSRKGIATVEGEPVEGALLEQLEQQAWSHWCNDSFWLNPIAKLFDEGTRRGLVDVEGGRGLLVEYESGGVTPGDAYLWIVDAEGVPKSWQMWTQILPLGGVEASWDDWVSSSTGARLATRHKTALFELVLSDLKTAFDLGAMSPATDPFAQLVERRQRGESTE